MKWVVVALLAVVPLAAQAYVGPGAGVGMIGSLLAVLGAVLLAIVGLILWPLRMIKKRRHKKDGSQG
jgi:Flp pilus assembly protein TadB